MRLFLSLLLLAGAVAAQDLPTAPSTSKSAAAAQTQPAAQPAQPAAQPVQPATAPPQAPPPATPAVAPAKPVAAPPAKAVDSYNDYVDTGTTIRKHVDEVNVIFTVTDKGGHFIKGLKQEDFKVLDDRKPPQSMVAFRSETNLPLRVGLLIDSSNSIRDRFTFEQEAAVEFLNQSVRPKVDKAFVIGFDSNSEVVADFTDNTEKLAHGVRGLRPGGGTALWDAVYFASREKLGKLQDEVAVRRAIVLLSDGDDNQSRVSRQEAIEMAQRAEVIVYVISTNISGVVSKYDKEMEELAEATGGRIFYPLKLEDIAEKFANIQEELRSQYAVAYKPTDFLADGRYRSIDILATNKKFKVRARKGYYAPKQ